MKKCYLPPSVRVRCTPPPKYPECQGSPRLVSCGGSFIRAGKPYQRLYSPNTNLMAVSPLHSLLQHSSPTLNTSPPTTTCLVLPSTLQRWRLPTLNKIKMAKCSLLEATAVLIINLNIRTFSELDYTSKISQHACEQVCQDLLHRSSETV